MQDFGDTLVVKVEGVPFPAAGIGLGLNKDGLGRDGGKFLVWVFEKILSKIFGVF